MKPTLGLFVIFDTRREQVRRCLESVQGCFDQLVAIDTGAKDDSAQIARELGANVIENPWTQFDEAYNFGIAQITTDWTFYLDSDEWLAPGSIDVIRSAIADSKTFACNVIREERVAQGQSAETWHFRLWRTHPKMRMIGVMHAAFPQSLVLACARGRSVRSIRARILHDGLTYENMAEKAKRQIPYLEKELELRPGQPQFEIALAESYMVANDPRGPELLTASVDKLIASARARQPLDTNSPIALACYLAYFGAETWHSDRSKAVSELTFSIFMNCPMPLYHLAVAAIKNRDFERAKRAVNQLNHLAKTNNYDRNQMIDPAVFGPALQDLMNQVQNGLDVTKSK